MERVERTCLCASLDLTDKEIDANVRYPVEEFFGLFRVLEQPGLAFLERLRAATLDHVREQRPRRAAEANERDLAV